MSVRLERIAPYHYDATLAFLDAAPFENVFLSYLVTMMRDAGLERIIYVALDHNNTIHGVCTFGRQVVFNGDDEAIDAFFSMAQRHPGEVMIVAPTHAVQRYWDRARPRHAPPRLTRERQWLMALDPTRLAQVRIPGVVGRLARPDEWEIVAANSAEMVTGELELPKMPDYLADPFGANIRAGIERQREWVGEYNGQLVFFCNIGCWSAKTAQLQGIWTPPEFRGNGYATAAFSAICSDLLQRIPSLTLYVNDFNERAIALYERVGFVRVGTFTTLVFAP